MLIRRSLNFFRYGYNNQYKINYTFYSSKYNSSRDYYKILSVKQNASEEQIKKAYYKLAKIYHPDVSKGNENKFKEVTQAYQVLSDEKIRNQYNSARTMYSFGRKVGWKARQGNYKYQEYQSVFSEMSQDQKKRVYKQINTALRILALVSGSFIVFLMIFMRTPHRVYQESNGKLYPLERTYPPTVATQPQISYRGGSPYENYGSPQSNYGQPMYPNYAAYQGNYPYNHPTGMPPQFQKGYHPQSNYAQPKSNTWGSKSSDL